jgi:hypothetical protein
VQQGAQLCLNGNFLVDRPEYPPLASRVLTSLGVAALPRRRDAHAQDGAQGHLSSDGLGGDPKHQGAIRPKPQCKLSRRSQQLTIYTNPRLQAISYAIHAHVREEGRGDEPMRLNSASEQSRNRRMNIRHTVGDRILIPRCGATPAGATRRSSASSATCRIIHGTFQGDRHGARQAEEDASQEGPSWPAELPT